MSVIPLIPERRSRRSEQTYRAITFQLEHVWELHGLRNFTLSDANGLVLAGAGHGEESRVVAAYAPLVAKCLNRERRDAVLDEIRSLVPILHGDEDLCVRSFFVDGERLFLCAVGDNGAGLDASIYRALTGIRRIYKQDRLAG